MTFSALEVRKLIGHPVIDTDGHLLEPTALLTDFLADLVGGKAARQAIVAAGRQVSMGDPATGRPRTGWWLTPSNARDVATAMAPALRAERASELGIDFSIVYPSSGLVFASLPEAEHRTAGVRAINNMNAEICRPYARVLTPAALIPMHNPDEAVAELAHASQMGFKVAVIPPLVARPLPADPAAFPRLCWLDSYGIDSDHDYDAVWAKFLELGMAVTAHGGVISGTPSGYASPSNYVFNHIGAHAFQQGHLCKSLVLAGIPRRFPGLTFAFLEGGTMWACDLLQSFLGHFHKRGPAGLRLLDPSLTDRTELRNLLERYGGKRFVAGMPQHAGNKLRGYEEKAASKEFEHSLINSADDLVKVFEQFYFGCEADDQGVAIALGPGRPFRYRIKAILGSDIGHWDVPDAAQVIPESYELVQDSMIDSDDYQDFAFRHAVLLHGMMNPGFFSGTSVADRAAMILRHSSPRTT